MFRWIIGKKLRRMLSNITFNSPASGFPSVRLAVPKWRYLLKNRSYCVFVLGNCRPGGSGTFAHLYVYSTQFYYQMSNYSGTSWYSRCLKWWSSKPERGEKTEKTTVLVNVIGPDMAYRINGRINNIHSLSPIPLGIPAQTPSKPAMVERNNVIQLTWKEKQLQEKMKWDTWLVFVC